MFVNLPKNRTKSAKVNLAKVNILKVDLLVINVKSSKKMNRNRESLYVNEQLIDTAEITIAFLEQTQQKRLTLDTPTPETQLTPNVKCTAN